ncbi:hypothetical protein AY599_12910 [Leptolyngbya valderiana BDU 20041]|nr:hypothetical protein AY599_12910 [Leptolyngbya valderiana BDU 20041]
MTGTNLLPRHRVNARRLRRCISAWTGTLGCLGLLVGAGLIAALATRAQPPAMPAGLTQQAESLEAELQATREEIATLKATRMARDRAAASLRWDPLLDIIAAHAATDVRLQSINVQPRRGLTGTWSLSMAGSAATKQHAADLAARLDATGLFESVRHAVTSPMTPSDRPGFSIECVIAPKATTGGAP